MVTDERYGREDPAIERAFDVLLRTWLDKPVEDRTDAEWRKHLAAWKKSGKETESK